MAAAVILGPVFLIGYRACGKTAVGRRLAERLGREFVDMDACVERELGTSISDCFARHGEEHFRDLESAALARVLEREAGPGLVVATGGGIVLRDANVRLMAAKAVVVWLQASVETIRERLAADPDSDANRPALTDLSTLEEVGDVLVARIPMYRRAADLRLSTDPPLSLDQIVEEICTALSDRSTG